MALLERVSTLVRANLNDLIDKAEEHEKLIKQVILDMNNQLLQVKTQVAIAIADQHLLEKKKLENDDKIQEWMRKAELAVDKKHDDLARAALLLVESYRDLSANFAQQREYQVRHLRPHEEKGGPRRSHRRSQSPTPGRRRRRPPRRPGKGRPHRAVVDRTKDKARSLARLT